MLLTIFPDQQSINFHFRASGQRESQIEQWWWFKSLSWSLFHRYNSFVCGTSFSSSHFQVSSTKRKYHFISHENFVYWPDFFPPLNRSWDWESINFKIILEFILEPIGSVSPKINIADRLSVTMGRSDENLSLICPAQAYPTPVFRWVSSLKVLFRFQSTVFNLFFQNQSFIFNFNFNLFF